MESDLITPEYVQTLQEPTDQFLCKLSDNWAGLKFRGFKIRDMISNMTLVEVPEDLVEDDDIHEDDDPSKRLIKYHMGPDFLELKTIGLTMNFSIGPKPINKFEVIDRHYFRGRVVR